MQDGSALITLRAPEDGALLAAGHGLRPESWNLSAGTDRVRLSLNRRFRRALRGHRRLQVEARLGFEPASSARGGTNSRHAQIPRPFEIRNTPQSLVLKVSDNQQFRAPSEIIISSRFRTTLASAVALLLCGGAVMAHAESTEQGNLLVSVSGRLTPHALPRKGTMPVSVTVGGKVSTTDRNDPSRVEDSEDRDQPPRQS